jgi:hypothetical protein
VRSSTTRTGSANGDADDARIKHAGRGVILTGFCGTGAPAALAGAIAVTSADASGVTASEGAPRDSRFIGSTLRFKGD